MSRIRKTEEQLQDQEVVRTIKAFLTVQATNWKDRQANHILPYVLHEIDEQRAAGNAIDVRELVKQVWLERQVPLPEIG